MRRGMSNVAGFVIGLLLGLFLFLVAGPLYGSIVNKSGESLDALQGCNAGLIGTLAGEGGQGVCYDSADAEDFRNYIKISDDMRVQYLGKGWGCPDKKEKEERDLESYAPYCYLVYYKDEAARSALDIARVSCEEGPVGTIGIQKEVQGSLTCLTQDAEGSSISSDEEIRIYYKPMGQETCTAKYTLNAGTTSIDSSATGPCEGPYLVTTVRGLLRDKDPALLNEGGTLKIIIVEGTEEHVATFKIEAPEKKICSTASPAPCIGRNPGPRQEGGVCEYAGGMCKYSPGAVCNRLVNEDLTPSGQTQVCVGATVLKNPCYTTGSIRGFTTTYLVCTLVTADGACTQKNVEEQEAMRLPKCA